MRLHSLTNSLFVCAFLLACAPDTGRKSAWDGIDYSGIARDKYRRDYDADYSLPAGRGCVDDAPGCF